MKVKDLKIKPQELPCCESCEHKGKGIRFCVETEKCFDILIHNDLVDLSPNLTQGASHSLNSD